MNPIHRARWVHTLQYGTFQGLPKSLTYGNWVSSQAMQNSRNVRLYSFAAMD